MDLLTLQIGAAGILLGIAVGSLMTLVLLKKLVNAPLQRFYQVLNHLSLYKLNLRKSHAVKTERIRELANKYDGVRENRRSEIITEYKDYISDLNQVLEDRGIGKVTPRGKP